MIREVRGESELAEFAVVPSHQVSRDRAKVGVPSGYPTGTCLPWKVPIHRYQRLGPLASNYSLSTNAAADELRLEALIGWCEEKKACLHPSSQFLFSFHSPIFLKFLTLVDIRKKSLPPNFNLYIQRVYNQWSDVNTTCKVTKEIHKRLLSDLGGKNMNSFSLMLIWIFRFSTISTYFFSN